MIVFYGFGGVQVDGGVVKQSKLKIVSLRCKYQNNNFLPFGWNSVPLGMLPNFPLGDKGFSF